MLNVLIKLFLKSIPNYRAILKIILINDNQLKFRVKIQSYLVL